MFVYEFPLFLDDDIPIFQTCYQAIYPGNTPAFIQACNILGIPTNANPDGGHTLGVYDVRKTVDPDTGKRVDAVGAYFVPASARSNLKVVTGAHVMFHRCRLFCHCIFVYVPIQATKIVFKPETDGEGKLIASGVQFVVNGKFFVVNVSKEIILSAGAVQTPQLLELSGVESFQLSRFKACKLMS